MFIQPHNNGLIDGQVCPRAKQQALHSGGAIILKNLAEHQAILSNIKN
jgi:hypothetical protein